MKKSQENIESFYDPNESRSYWYNQIKCGDKDKNGNFIERCYYSHDYAKR